MEVASPNNPASVGPVASPTPSGPETGRPNSGPEPVRLGSVGATVLEVIAGSLTALPLDAIVCPANSFLQMRGGLSAHIRENAGKDGQIERDAVALGPIRLGDAVITAGYELPAHWVIHAPTVEMPVDRSSVRTVALATIAALRVASRHSIQSLGLPAMGTGTGGVTFAEAAPVMLRETYGFLRQGDTTLRRVIFAAWEREFAQALLSQPFPPPTVPVPSTSFANPQRQVLEWVSR